MPRTTTNTRTQIQNIPCSLSFNGTSSKVVATGVTPTSNGGSMAVWLKIPTLFSTFTRIFDWRATSGGYGGFTIEIDGTNPKIFLGVYNGSNTLFSVTSTGVFPLNTWFHLVAQWTQTVGNIYINGVSAGSGSLSTWTVPSGQTPTIGSASVSGSFFVGKMTQFIYADNTQWSAEQIANLYQSGTVTSSTTLTYNLTEGAGTTAYDTSGNGNNGTITAGTYTSDVPTTTRKLVGGNLVYNGNFEFAPPSNTAQTSLNWVDGTSGGSSSNGLFGWAQITHNGSGGCLFDSANPHTGNYGFKVSTTATASVLTVRCSKSGAQPQNFIIVNPNTSYTCTFWMKTTANSGAANTGAYFNPAEYTGTLSNNVNHNTGLITTTTGWTQYSVTFTTAAATQYIVPTFSVTGSDGTGTLIMDAWFDDIVLVPTVNTTRSLASNRNLAV